jgi:predicted Zn-ribbon and HTH transcriptional regulator
VVTKIDKEKQMEDKYMEPTKCDWCGKEYELSEGTNVMGDNLCPNCTSIYEEERDVY